MADEEVTPPAEPAATSKSSSSGTSKESEEASVTTEEEQTEEEIYEQDEDEEEVEEEEALDLELEEYVMEEIMEEEVEEEEIPFVSVFDRLDAPRELPSPREITADILKMISVQLGQIRLCWPKVVQEVNIDFLANVILPDGFLMNTNKEKLLLLYCENFRQQYHQKFPHRKPLLLAADNVVRQRKMVCTTLRPTTLTHPNLSTWEELASFVSDHVLYEPMSPPTDVNNYKIRKNLHKTIRTDKKLLVGLKVSEKDINDVVVEVGPSLRDNCVESFNALHKAEVPVLAFSASLGDAVVAVLKHCNVLLPNVKVISIFLKKNNDGVIERFNDKMINVFNKNELALQGTDYENVIQDRGNIILMGNALGDVSMADGVRHSNAVLKIGFLYNHVDGNLPGYMDKFDIVFEDDQTMNVLNTLLQLIIN